MTKHPGARAKVIDAAPLAASVNTGADEQLAAEVAVLIRAKNLEGAAALVEQRLPDAAGATVEQLFQRARLLDDAGRFDLSDPLFERLIVDAPTALITEIQVYYAKRLRKRGLIIRAEEVLAPLAADPATRKGPRALATENSHLVALLRRLEPVRLTRDADARTLALHQAILMFEDRVPRYRQQQRAGKVALITGSLGPGGAERQIARIAVNLEAARKNGHQLGKVMIDQPVEIIVKSLKVDQVGAFFATDVIAAGVKIIELNEVAASQPEIHLPADRATDLARLLKLLPPQANYGVARLTQHLVDRGTDVASIWQDGACLYAGLAALIAGVPTIHLSFRGLPPSIREHMFRPEYEDLYQALAKVPGVQLHCNSKVTAREYAAWLKLPLERFEVIYNGVAEADAEGGDGDRAMLDAFVARTADATRTIGGVFRLYTDKRPLLWVKLAARYHKRHPASRFIIVGGGRMLPQAQQLADELGIRDRILFVGNSTGVGFWMANMDVVVLMSRYEGLPNVLIEAQMAGVAVVSTPAGGAAECFVEGVTGRILGDVEKPDLDEGCDCIDAMITTGAARAALSKAAREHAIGKFSVPRMIGQFAGTCTAVTAELPDQRQAA